MIGFVPSQKTFTLIDFMQIWLFTGVNLLKNCALERMFGELKIAFSMMFIHHHVSNGF